MSGGSGIPAGLTLSKSVSNNLITYRDMNGFLHSFNLSDVARTSTIIYYCLTFFLDLHKTVII